MLWFCIAAPQTIVKLSGLKQQRSFIWLLSLPFGQGSAGEAHLSSMYPLLGLLNWGWRVCFQGASLTWLVAGAGWWRRPQLGLSFGTLMHGLALWLLGFFPACQVGSKSECSKTQEVEAFLWVLQACAWEQLSVTSTVFYCSSSHRVRFWGRWRRLGL